MRKYHKNTLSAIFTRFLSLMSASATVKIILKYLNDAPWNVYVIIFLLILISVAYWEEANLYGRRAYDAEKEEQRQTRA